MDTDEEQDEEEEEDDQYTYEVPPSEGHNKRLAPAKQQEAAENVYLDRPTLRRFSEPNNFLQTKPSLLPSKHGAQSSSEEELTKLQSIEKDPFPSLKDEEESTYLEFEPSPAPLPCKLHYPPLPFPVFTRPLKQLSSVPFSPTLGQRSPRLEPYRTLQRTHLRDPSVQNKSWYAGSCDRHTAEAALLRFNKDSAYMVRQSSGHGWNQPYTLVVLYKSRVYNIPIRYLEGSHQYTLGKDGKSHEELFDNISCIIQSYTERPLVLIDGTTSTKEQTCLLFPVKP
uniref:Uncharacterized protein n=1 Tax=Sphaerodactylus townsendi TaxID=933632 RepID=A0ACB8EY91_9SAUR